MKTSKKSGIILDRDGVLVQNKGLVWQVKQLRLSPKITLLIKYFNQKKIPIIIITNQPVVARGWITEKEVKKLHQILQQRLNKRGAFIDKFYFCPHHPKANLKKYRMNCSCRKPKIGLFKKAIKEFKLDPKKTITIGDMTQDILAGKKAEIKSILVKTAWGGKDKKYKIKPNWIAKNPFEALKLAKKIFKP